MKKHIPQFVFEQHTPLDKHITTEISLQTVTSKVLLHAFYQLPYRIYKNNHYWVPQQWKELQNFCKTDNPFWQHAEIQLFIVYKNTVPAGRIAAIIDYNLPQEKQKRIGYFGLFECTDDDHIAHTLFEATQSWLQSKQMDIMRGPINGRIDLGSGLVIKGFHSIPYLMGTYNPKYYIRFVEQFNMKKSRDLVSYHIDLTQPIPTDMKKTKERCEKAGVHIRPFSRLHFKKDITLWYDLLLEVFADHYGYTLSSHAEMEKTFGIKEIRFVMNPRLFLFAELNGEAIGFRFSLPDFNPLLRTLKGKIGIRGVFHFISHLHRLERGRFIVMGIKKNHRGQGIGTTMNYYTLLEMKRKGYTTAEYGWIDETNIGSRKAGEKMGGTIYKIYRVFEKNIS